MAKKINEKDELSLVSVDTDILKNIDEADRRDWTFETYVSVGTEAIQVKAYTQWILGKLASEVSKKWKTDVDFAEKIGVPIGSLRAYKSVYEKFTETDENYVPANNLPWGVLLIASQAENPVETVEKLSSNGTTSVQGAYREIKQQKTGKIAPPKPRIRLEYDEVDNRWIIDIAQEDMPNISWFKVREKLIQFWKNL